jgi:hypothetical protein
MQRTFGYFDHSTLHSELTPIPINDGDRTIKEVVKDMHWLGRTDMAEEIGTGRTNGQSAGCDKLAGVWVFRRPDTYKASLGSYDQRQFGEIGFENDGERAGPELLSQQLEEKSFSLTHEN